jgi:serine protease Do
LRKLNRSVDALIKKVSPSVVQILVTGYGPLEEGERGSTASVIGRQRAIGSGFVIDASGYIVTNAHVVNGAQRVQVVLPNMGAEGSLEAALSTRTTVVPARIVGVTKESDLVVLKVDGRKLPALELATDLRDPFGILVAARAAGASVEVPLNSGDVIRTLNGQPMTTLERLRSALKALPVGAPVALQIQRDQKLLFLAFTLDQP